MADLGHQDFRNKSSRPRQIFALSRPQPSYIRDPSFKSLNPVREEESKITAFSGFRHFLCALKSKNQVWQGRKETPAYFFRSLKGQ